MKRKNILIALTLLLSLTANAQNAAQAKQILDKAAKLITRKGGASANFTIDGGASGKLSGTLYVKGNKFYAKTTQAATWYNGKTQWTYLAKSEEVNVSNPNAAQQAQMNPYTFITLYKKGYALAMKQAGANYQIHLKDQKKQSIQEMYVTINKATNLPTQVRMRQNNKWSTITISNFQMKTLSDALFTFNAKNYPNAEIIDLR
ncbi:MAG: cell envelope biogenesis protein LolA [Prevotella sp.]|nr:cell envelope biogenesis protein LolA [Prevotella sp.]